MGKPGVAGLTILTSAAVVLAALLPAGEARAQDFGQTWIDRITHELEQERGPLQAKPFAFTAEGGVNLAHDSNVFLTQTSKKSDTIIIPFVQAGFTYGEPRFDLEASALVDYKDYLKEKASGDEERVFLRARQTASRWNFEISEIFQNVIDPSGVLFLNRVRHIVSNTVPKLAFDIGRSWGIETSGNIQIVRFKDQPYSSQQENNNFSLDLTGVYRTPWAFDLVAQIGYYNINYLESQVNGGTPDAFGYYYRVGFRGQVVERLTLEALIGYTDAHSDFFVSTGNDINKRNLGAILNLRWEATEKLNLFFDFARQYAFEGFGDPFQLLNTVSVYAKYELTDVITTSLRLQADISDSALNVRRTYYAAALAGTYKITEHIVADAGVTYRGGKTENATTVKFTDLIFSIGIAFSW
jgi:hypothetical protein